MTDDYRFLTGSLLHTALYPLHFTHHSLPTIAYRLKTDLWPGGSDAL